MNETNYLKPVSKAIYILSNIMKWLMIVSASLSLIVGIASIFFAKSIKIVDNSVYLSKIKLADFASEELMSNESLKATFESAKSFLQTNNNIMLIPVYILVGMVVLVILVFLFHYLYKLFKNIYNDDTPFTKENISILSKLAYVVIIYVCIPSLLSYIVKWIFGIGLIFDWGLIDIFCILIIFAIKYIFEYGYNIENKKKK